MRSSCGLSTRGTLAFHALVVAGVCGCAQLETAPSADQPAQPAPTAPSQPSATPAAPSKPETSTAFRQRGRISRYGAAFAGKPTASGETFDPERLTMAHRTLPFGTRVRVTNLENQKSVEVVVNDRGPAIADRIADLSLGAARRLGMIGDGVVDALLEIVSPGGS